MPKAIVRIRCILISSQIPPQTRFLLARHLRRRPQIIAADLVPAHTSGRISSERSHSGESSIDQVQNNRQTARI